MKTYRNFYLLGFVLFLVSGLLRPAYSQVLVKEGPKGFECQLIGRVFFDGGYFINDPQDLKNSFQVNDVRLGARIRFLEDWEAKIELGYGDNKISFKDVYLDYKIGTHLLRLGYYYEPFGNSRVGTANFRFMTSATADKVLGNSRKLGLSYIYDYRWFNFMGGIFSDGDIQKSKSVDQGYSIAAKVVGRPLMSDKKLIHIGVAPRFSSSADQVRFSGGMPTDLLDKSDNVFADAKVSQVINQWKLDLELILLYNKWYFQGQYFLNHVNRYGIENYNGKGGYVQAGYMILGEKHNYNAATGMIVNPAPKSLELLCRYDQVNLNDAGIQGGRLSDITVGLNYFLNKYVAAKLNYSRVMPGNTSPMGGEDFDLIHARIQLSF